MKTVPSSAGYASLLRQVTRTIEAIENSDEASSTVIDVARSIVENFRSQLGISGGRLYRMEGDRYMVIGHFGDAAPVESGFEVPIGYAPIQRVLEEGSVYMTPSDAGFDSEVESQLGVRSFAAIAVGEKDFILSFDVDGTGRVEEVLYSLSLIRHAVNQKLRQEQFEQILTEAKKIQASILPKRLPKFADFDMGGASEPATIVGGDFYDVIPVSDRIVGLAIADASGHGLPAALQVRDIYMGLRMGVARDFKIVRTIEKLNEIVNRSKLTTKFVSLFYGELETNGNFIYVNAGHNPPFIVKRTGRNVELRHGGIVLGPTPDATYGRGFATVEPGDLLVLYTDGIVEATNARGQEFSLARLERLVKKHAALSARGICEHILADTRRWSGGRQEDDRTLLIVKHLSS